VRKVGTQTTYFFDDPSGRILTELRINSEVYGGAVYGKDYVYLPEGPIARVDWSDIPNPNYYPCRQSPEVICPPPRVAIADLSYYHTDHLGTPLAMTDQNGELAWQAEYLPFGELFSNEISTAGNNLRFPGQYFDSETGLHQNWFRDYDPKTGRYVEADPIGLEVGTNLFSYVYANPGSFLDLDGLCPCGLPEDVIWAAWSDTKDWSKAADRTDVNPGFPSGTYKCNLFADASYEKTGYHLPNIGGGLFARLFGKYPPGAQSLSDPSYSVPGWPLVSGPAQPGDLLAFQGHVAIATMPGHSVSASPDGVVANDWGFRRGQTPVIRRCKCP